MVTRSAAEDWTGVPLAVAIAFDAARVTRNARRLEIHRSSFDGCPPVFVELHLAPGTRLPRAVVDAMHAAGCWAETFDRWCWGEWRPMPF
jgi:hypothetical protein